MKKKYQVVIIGAGPAGVYAAKTIARAGLDVLIVERDKQIGVPLCCAEAVSYIGLTNFVTPSPDFVANTIYGLQLNVSSGNSVTYGSESIMGYVLDRPVLERQIATQAVASGVELALETYASGIDLRGDGLAQLTLEQRDKTFDIQAEYIIAADGVESRIGKLAGLPTGLKLKQCESALQYRVSNIELDASLMQFYAGPKYSPNGYLWVFPKSENVANIGVGLNPAEADHRQLQVLLDSFIREHFPQGKIEFVSCGMVPKFIGFEILGKDNMLLAGDAARLIDSLSGAGIARAFHTGKLAAETIIRAITEHWANNRLQKEYRTIVDKEIGRDMRVLQKAYPVFRKFSERDWDSLADFLKGYLKNRKAESLDPAAIIKSVLTTAPGLIRLARHLF